MNLIIEVESYFWFFCTLTGKHRIKIFLKFSQVIFIDRFPTKRTLTFSFDPTLDALRVEVVFDVARKRSYLILFCKLWQTDRAIFLTGKLLGIKRSCRKSL